MVIILGLFSSILHKICYGYSLEETLLLHTHNICFYTNPVPLKGLILTLKFNYDLCGLT